MNAFSQLASRQIWFLRATWPPLGLALLSALVALLSPVWWLGGLGFAGVIILAFDCMARQRDFDMLRTALRREGGLRGEAMARFRKARTAWCSRRAAIAAAHAEGFGFESRRIVHGWGYRPWHVFPDRAFSFQSPFLRLDFWKSVLGVGR